MTTRGSDMKVAAVIVAAGRGTRAGGGLPKQWRQVAGRSVVAHSIEAFRSHPGVSRIVLVVHPDDMAAARILSENGLTCIAGGATRAASVRAGLAALDEAVTHVLIHDAARPCLGAEVIDGVLDALRAADAAAPAVAVVDALWAGEDGKVAGTVDRRGLFRAQTPQGFSLALIRTAHARFPQDADDDVALARRAGHAVVITAGSEDNIKITTPEDFARAERIMRAAHGHQTG